MMRILKVFVVYAALGLGAIVGGANLARADVAQLAALATGDLAKIRFSVAPQAVPAASYTTADGKTETLEAYRGKYVLLNFWALWCAPCVEEMPVLNALGASFEGTGFEVVTIATGRNARPAVDTFFAKNELTSLPKLFDPKMSMARAFGALGLPVTVMIDPQGREVGRAQGALHWDSPEAKALFKAWIAQS